MHFYALVFLGWFYKSNKNVRIWPWPLTVTLRAKNCDSAQNRAVLSHNLNVIWSQWTRPVRPGRVWQSAAMKLATVTRVWLILVCSMMVVRVLIPWHAASAGFWSGNVRHRITIYSHAHAPSTNEMKHIRVFSSYVTIFLTRFHKRAMNTVFVLVIVTVTVTYKRTNEGFLIFCLSLIKNNTIKRNQKLK